MRKKERDRDRERKEITGLSLSHRSQKECTKRQGGRKRERGKDGERQRMGMRE